MLEAGHNDLPATEAPMDPYEYQDMLADVWEQLPPGVQAGVNLAIECEDICEPRIAIFTRPDGTRKWEFVVRPNGQITDEAITRLCLEV
jgi:hypothetical protein